MFGTRLDSVYKIGESHDVCQDYAIHQNVRFRNLETKEIDEFNTLVLCDGCSSSHEITKKVDFGAKALAWNVVNTLKEEIPYIVDTRYRAAFWEEKFDKKSFSSKFIYNLYDRCCDFLITYNFPTEVLDATILVVVQYQNYFLQFTLGDGVCFFQYQNKKKYRKTVFNSNAPFYFSYVLEPQHSLFNPTGVPNEKNCNKKRIWNYMEFFGDKSCYVECNSIREKIFFPNDYDYDLFDENPQIDLYANFMADRINVFKNLDLIAIASDGLSSFIKANNEPVDELQLTLDLFDYKNFNGDFVKRKVNFFQRKWVKEGIKHHDDISFASLKINKKLD